MTGTVRRRCFYDRRRPPFSARRRRVLPRKPFGGWRYSLWFNAYVSCGLGYAVSAEKLATAMMRTFGR
jgi:hypothetical protein